MLLSISCVYDERWKWHYAESYDIEALKLGTCVEFATTSFIVTMLLWVWGCDDDDGWQQVLMLFSSYDPLFCRFAFSYSRYIIL